MTSVRVWGPGVGAVVVLVATGAWARGSTGVDAGLWADVRPAIEARLVAQAQGDGYGESEPALRAKWFCEAEALDLQESDGLVRAGVDTLCMEYGVREGALVECSGADVPQVMRLERETGSRYRVVAQEEAPDGAGSAEWAEDHFGSSTASRLGDAVDSSRLESRARTYFSLPAGSPVKDC
ncbi:hypothetical protein [Streptomyces sp. NPDC002588]|uniref:hypothetical protein n=1 Tax=Streptomyces sp. NPDC002588 TaxID=3154419 RepID=UPI00331AE0AD